MGRFKWLYPGMRIKRWILLCVLSVCFVTIGFFINVTKSSNTDRTGGSLVLILGVALLYISVRKMIKTFVTIFLPERENELVDIVYQKRLLERGPKIVAIGGGTGLSVLLHGLKEYSSNITAIVTVADDGGSSGRLREQFDMLPPGDIRNCLVALADTEPLMRNLFQFRFKGSSELNGHSFGNLFITALSEVTGDFEKAIKESSKILSIRGRVIPSTTDKVVLKAEFDDGSVAEGESNITKSAKSVKRIFIDPHDCRPSQDVLEAINSADAVIFGPGSLYTSVIPNLLVKDISDAVISTKAIKVYICNVMTEHGETDRYTTLDHINAIARHASPKVVDYCIVNNAKVPVQLLERYKNENKFPVIVNSKDMERAGYRVIEGEVISTKDFVRHDSEKLARIVINLILHSKNHR